MISSTSTPIARILVATDFSSCADRALDVALGLATKLGARLHLVYASEIPGVLAGDAAALGERFVDADVKEAQERLARLLDELRARGFTVDGEVCVGFPLDVILDRAKPDRHDLLVVGTHGRTGVRRMWMGSVAERLVRASEIPVLTVRADASRT